MAISITDLLMIFSGTGVTTPIASIGGVWSAGIPNEVRSQSASGISSVTGVSVVDAYGNTEGIGTLQYVQPSDTILWYPPGVSTGTGKAITETGTYTIGNSGGYLIIDVTYASFPAQSESDSVTISNVPQNIFDDVTDSQSFLGNTEYRCFYIANNHATSTAYNVTIWVYSQPDIADTVSIALDPGGLEVTALGPLNDTEDSTDILGTAGVVFTSPSNSASGLVMGTMLATESYAFWVKRVTPLENRFSAAENKFSIGLSLTSNP